MNININNLTNELKKNLETYNENIIKNSKISTKIPDLSVLNKTLESLKNKFKNIYALLNEINDKLSKNDTIEIKLDEKDLIYLDEINKLNKNLNEYLNIFE